MNKYNIFLIDGAGAFLSAVFLWALAQWEAFFGMPAAILYRLLPLPMIFIVYDLTCFVLKPDNWQRCLKGIAWANLLYGILTISLVWRHSSSLTSWGMAYFIAEAIIIGILVAWELSMARSKI